MGFFDDASQYFDPSQDQGPGASDQGPMSFMLGSGNDPSQLDSRGTVPNIAGLPGQPAQSGVPSILQKLLGGSQKGSNLADISSLLGKFGQGQANQRVNTGNLTQNYDKLALEAQTGRNQNESDALKKLAQTAYIGNGGSTFKLPTSLNLGGKSYDIPQLGGGPQAPTAPEKAGAASLQGQLQARLSPGGSVSPTPLDSYAKPGAAENIGNYGALAAGGLGALSNMGLVGGDQPQAPNGAAQGLGQAAGIAGAAGSLGKNLSGLSSSSNGIMSGLGTAGSTIGKLLPFAGMGTGIAGLIANKGLGSNIMSGASTGASLGSIVPGLGTLVGGGIGAIVGGLRGLIHGGPNQTEVAGRAPEAQFEQSFGGFQPMMNAVGTGYSKTGHSAQEAQTDVKNMMDAEKLGPGAVAQMMATIKSKMGAQ